MEIIRTANFKEEFSAKIPALTLLTNLGYEFIPPSECEVLRGNTSVTVNGYGNALIVIPVVQVKNTIDDSLRIDHITDKLFSQSEEILPDE